LDVSTAAFNRSELCSHARGLTHLKEWRGTKPTRIADFINPCSRVLFQHCQDYLARRRHSGGTLAPALQVMVWRTGGMSPSGMIKPPGWGITGWKLRTAKFRALDYF
jgi:hypothetical protein